MDGSGSCEGGSRDVVEIGVELSLRTGKSHLTVEKDEQTETPF